MILQNQENAVRPAAQAATWSGGPDGVALGYRGRLVAAELSDASVRGKGSSGTLGSCLKNPAVDLAIVPANRQRAPKVIPTLLAMPLAGTFAGHRSRSARRFLKHMKTVALSLACLWCCSACVSVVPSAEKQIRFARAQADAAFLRRDFATVALPLVENVQLTGPVWRTLNKDELLKRHGRLCKERTDVSWTHFPQKIRINTNWRVAAETGVWRERWTAPDGPVEIEGSYSALWRQSRDQWLLDSEVFVPLKCTGGEYCRPE